MKQLHFLTCASALWLVAALSWSAAADVCDQWELLSDQTSLRELATYNGELVAAKPNPDSTGPNDTHHVVRWTGSEWEPLGGGMNGTIRVLAEHDGSLYAGGEFNSVDEVTTARVARWDGRQWHAIPGHMSVAEEYWGQTQVWVSAIAFFEGDLVVLGRFTHIDEDLYNSIALWDGVQWHPLDEGLTLQSNMAHNYLFVAEGTALAVHENDLFAAGSFNHAGENPAQLVARWNGKEWDAANNGMFGIPHVLLNHYDGLLAGTGDVRIWNGASWQPYGVSNLGTVRSLIEFNGELIVGGTIAAVGPFVTDRVVRFTGTESQPMGTFEAENFAASSIQRLVVVDDALYALAFPASMARAFRWKDCAGEVGACCILDHCLHMRETMCANLPGEFAGAGSTCDVASCEVSCGQVVPMHAPLNALSGSAGQLPRVSAMALHEGDLVLAGRFTGMGSNFNQNFNNIRRWNGVDWPTMGTGLADIMGPPSSQPTNNAAVVGLVYSNGDLYAGGTFPGRLKRWNGSTWESTGHPEGGYTKEYVYSVGIFDGEVVTGSGTTSWQTYTGTVRRYHHSQFGKVWLPLFSSGKFNGHILALHEHHGQLFIGGAFTLGPADVKVSSIARGTESGVVPVGGGADGPVRAFGSFHGDLYVGGDFVTAGGVKVNHIARWDGEEWHPLGQGLNGTVRAIAEYDGDLYAGGDFTQAGGLPANRLARWDGSGWHAVHWGVSAPVYAFFVWNHDLYIGGNFSAAGPLVNRYLARYSPCGYEPSPGDLTGDGTVGIEDLLILLSQWGPCPDCAPESCPADLNGDCSVGVADLLILLANWN